MRQNTSSVPLTSPISIKLGEIVHIDHKCYWVKGGTELRTNCQLTRGLNSDPVSLTYNY